MSVESGFLILIASPQVLLFPALRSLDSGLGVLPHVHYHFDFDRFSISISRSVRLTFPLSCCILPFGIIYLSISQPSPLLSRSLHLYPLAEIDSFILFCFCPVLQLWTRTFWPYTLHLLAFFRTGSCDFVTTQILTHITSSPHYFSMYTYLFFRYHIWHPRTRRILFTQTQLLTHKLMSLPLALGHSQYQYSLISSFLHILIYHSNLAPASPLTWCSYILNTSSSDLLDLPSLLSFRSCIYAHTASVSYSDLGMV